MQNIKINFIKFFFQKRNYQKILHFRLLGKDQHCLNHSTTKHYGNIIHFLNQIIMENINKLYLKLRQHVALYILNHVDYQVEFLFIFAFQGKVMQRVIIDLNFLSAAFYILNHLHIFIKKYYLYKVMRCQVSFFYQIIFIIYLIFRDYDQLVNQISMYQCFGQELDLSMNYFPQKYDFNSIFLELLYLFVFHSSILFYHRKYLYVYKFLNLSKKPLVVFNF